MLTTPEEEDEDEHFEDAPSEDEEDNDDDEKKSNQKSAQNNARANYYDGRKRDPRFSKAETSCLWELIPFRNHYHPSVAKYANMLFNDEKIAEQSDMHNYTLIHFLDRFVYRNPKKTATTRGKSIMQPLPGRQDGGILMTRGNAQEEHAIPVNSEAFWRKKIEDVPVDEVRFERIIQEKIKMTDKRCFIRSFSTSISNKNVLVKTWIRNLARRRGNWRMKMWMMSKMKMKSGEP